MITGPQTLDPGLKPEMGGGGLGRYFKQASNKATQEHGLIVQLSQIYFALQSRLSLCCLVDTQLEPMAAKVIYSRKKSLTQQQNCTDCAAVFQQPVLCVGLIFSQFVYNVNNNRRRGL